MTEQTHTPGPWVIHIRGNQDVVRGPATECVAVVPSPDADGYGLSDKAERKANARLISAAPDMLTELQSLLLLYGQQATADVIAKATGKRNALT